MKEQGRKTMKRIRIKVMRFKFIDPALEGVCLNENRPRRAGDRICGVGIVKRGRRLGDYAGRYCAECPYWKKVKQAR